MFFSEEKNQKTFANWLTLPVGSATAKTSPGAGPTSLKNRDPSPYHEEIRPILTKHIFSESDS
jgi:hypothetical protein